VPGRVDFENASWLSMASPLAKPMSSHRYPRSRLAAANYLAFIKRASIWVRLYTRF
jgi:hypothetical protein